MNHLVDLQELYATANIKTKHDGWYLTAGKDVWTMLDGAFYKNGEQIKEKDIKLYIKKLK